MGGGIFPELGSSLVEKGNWLTDEFPIEIYIFHLSIHSSFIHRTKIEFREMILKVCSQNVDNITRYFLIRKIFNCKFSIFIFQLFLAPFFHFSRTIFYRSKLTSRRFSVLSFYRNYQYFRVSCS